MWTLRFALVTGVTAATAAGTSSAVKESTYAGIIVPGDGHDPARVAYPGPSRPGRVPIRVVYLPFAGSIGTRIVARLF
jgi:hypothetical protein